MKKNGKVFYLPDIITNDCKLDCSKLSSGCQTKFISITGQDGSGKTNLRNELADHYAEQGAIVVTAKSPCDRHTVELLNNSISQNGYSDVYTENLLFSFMDGLLSNYMVQLNGKCDYFICQRGPVDQYVHGLIRGNEDYKEIYKLQKPERLMKFDVYVHMNASADVAWNRIKADDDKDRYEYPEYFAKQSPNTRKLYEDIKYGNQEELNFLREAKNFYIDTTNLTIEQVRQAGINLLEKNKF